MTMIMEVVKAFVLLMLLEHKEFEEIVIQGFLYLIFKAVME